MVLWVGYGVGALDWAVIDGVGLFAGGSVCVGVAGRAGGREQGPLRAASGGVDGAAVSGGGLCTVF